MSELFRSALGFIAPQNGGSSGGNTENEGFVGDTVNLPDRKLKIVKLIAEGGFSYVFQSTDCRTGEFMAIKRILTPDKESVKWVEEEINFMRNLNHPNIIKFYGSIRNNMEHLIIMEYCRIPLPQLPLSYNHVGQVFGQTCRAIEYLHKIGIVHRDIKLENLLIGDDGLVKLVDFGSATVEKFQPEEDWSAVRRNILEESIAQKTTPMYRAPEMVDLWLNYPIDERSDLWALGCLLFTLCYNSHPFQDSNKLAIVNAKYIIPKNDTTYTPYGFIIRGLLKVDPKERIKFMAIFEHLSSIAESSGFHLTDKLPFRPPVAPPPPLSSQQQMFSESIPNNNNNKPAASASLFNSLRGGAENIFKNIKESSQKYISSVPFPNTTVSTTTEPSSRQDNQQQQQQQRQDSQRRNSSQNIRIPSTTIKRENSIEKPTQSQHHHQQRSQLEEHHHHQRPPPPRPKPPPGPIVENLLGLSMDESEGDDIFQSNNQPQSNNTVDSGINSQLGDLLGDISDFLAPTINTTTTTNIPIPQQQIPSTSVPNQPPSIWSNPPSAATTTIMYTNTASASGNDSKFSNNKVDLLGDPFDFGQPTLVNSTSFHDLPVRAEKIVKNSSTPNLSDLILDDIMTTSGGGGSKNNLQQQQLPTIIPTPVNSTGAQQQQQQQPTFQPNTINQNNSSTARPNYNRNFFVGEQPAEKKQDFNCFFGDLLNSQGFTATSNGNKTINDLRRVEIEKEMDPLQIKINDWREGKKKNIRALLSSLHTVTWSTCHWEETNMSQMITPAQVKKVYRKACLAIHPDKQMNTEHEELAKMIFVELNEAWAAFEETSTQ